MSQVFGVGGVTNAGPATGISTSAVQMRKQEDNPFDTGLLQFSPNGVPTSPDLGGSLHQMT